MNNKISRLNSRLEMHDKMVILERETDYDTDRMNDGG